MNVKYCSYCGVDHPLPEIGEQNEFWRWQKNKSLINGGYHVCLAWYRKYQLDYKRTREGWARATYHIQRKSSKFRKHPMPDYTMKEFMDWAFSQGQFEQLYSDWVDSGYSTSKRPSPDRIDDFKPYTLDNLRLVTFSENHLMGVKSSKAHKAYDRVNAEQGIPVNQYTLEGKLLATYKSSYVAAQATGVDQSSITKCCRGKAKTAGGFKWGR